MKQNSTLNVAISGAGLAGVTVALTLAHNGIASTIYERRPQGYHDGSGNSLGLSPNALRMLNRLGIYQSIRKRGHESEALFFRNAEHKVLDTVYWGIRDIFGYPMLRIYRGYLLEELKTAALKSGKITIEYERAIDCLTSENVNGISFKLKDGSIRTAGLLIVADSVHSRIRNQLFASISNESQYTGSLAIFGIASLKDIPLPSSDYILPSVIMSTYGSIALVPTVPNMSEVLVVHQRSAALRSREEWANLTASPEDIMMLLRENMKVFPEFAQIAMEAIKQTSLTIWPHELTPMLESWTSPIGKAVFVGDAAHAMPPSGAQGANQAIRIPGVTTNYLLALKLKQHGDLEPDPYGLNYGLNGPRNRYKGLNIPIHVRHSNFKLPSNPAISILMVGPGTGVAPFRGFVQERAAQARGGAHIGKMVLFFGCERSDEDFLYQDDWDQYKAQLGDKFDLVTAFSREGAQKIYVQQRLRDRGKEINEMLLQEAYFYVCGDAANMAREVNTIVGSIIAEQRGVAESKGQEIVQQMRTSNRYQEDVWS